jgi:DNA invertase Pin-like site-specific DNA recombinase
LQLLSYVAENERVNIKQRQAEGIAAAKARGVKFGRPVKYRAEDYVEIYKKFKRKEISQKQAMEMMGVCRSTYYKIVDEVKELIK